MTLEQHCIARLKTQFETGDFDVSVYSLFPDLTTDPHVMKMIADSLQNQGLIEVTYQSGQLTPYMIYVLPAILDA